MEELLEGYKFFCLASRSIVGILNYEEDLYFVVRNKIFRI
jgi:hypothetical protein